MYTLYTKNMYNFNIKKIPEYFIQLLTNTKNAQQKLSCFALMYFLLFRKTDSEDDVGDPSTSRISETLCLLSILELSQNYQRDVRSNEMKAFCKTTWKHAGSITVVKPTISASFSCPQNDTSPLYCSLNMKVLSKC